MPPTDAPASARPPGGGSGYAAFLERLAGYERLEPFARSRGPEKLDGVRRIAETLGHPERAFRVVHVAGTNGKGLTAAMIARLIGAAGHPCGLYTSPHVVDIRERVAFTGPVSGSAASAPVQPGRAALIDPGAFAAAGHRVLDQADALAATVHFSYFDLLTLAALVAFREAGVRWAVLETGLGGRSDATNITPKELCVLTRIGLDHLHVLGDDLRTIAGEKLGIVPPGTPTVLMEQPDELRGWLEEELAALNAPLHPAADFRPEPTADGRGVRGTVAGVVAGVALDWPDEAPPLSPPRLACAGAALAAVQVVLGSTDEGGQAARLRTALETTLPGRLERRRDQPVPGGGGARWPLVVLDGGHNPDALAALNAQLAAWEVREGTLLLALQRDKLIEALREPLRALLARMARVAILEAQTVRAPGAAELRDFLAPLLPGGVTLEAYPHAGAAVAAAGNHPEAPLVVAGSLWTVGDVLRLLDGEPET